MCRKRTVLVDMRMHIRRKQDRFSASSLLTSYMFVAQSFTKALNIRLGNEIPVLISQNVQLMFYRYFFWHILHRKCKLN